MSGFEPPRMPVPAMAMSFAPPPFARRPFILTAIAIVGFLVALATLMGSFVIAVTTMVAVGQASSRPMMIAPAPVVAQRNPLDPEEDESNGLAKPQRQIVVAALRARPPLQPVRRRQLDALLAQAGKRMFPLADSQPSMTMLRNSVTESGVLPSPRGGEGPHFFVIGTGRIEIYDDHAVFRPTGSAQVVSASAVQSAQAPTVVRQRNAGPITTVAISGKAKTAGGFVIMITVIDALFSALLAIYLIFAAIMVLRDSLLGRRLHWIYVWIKIPLALLAGAANWWAWSSFIAQASTSNATSPSASPFVNFPLDGLVLAVALLALTYPVVLIFVLSSRTVRDYYFKSREEAAASVYYRPR